MSALSSFWSFVVRHIWPALVAFPWVATVQAIAPIWVAIVATRALKTWKAQQQAERKAKFLDEIIECVYQYLDGLVKPITMADFVKIGIDGHIPPGTTDRIIGAIAFITKDGQREAVQMFAALKECEPSKRRIETLSVKGQVLGFRDYVRCQRSIALMLHEIGKLAALAAMLSSVSLNWANPEVRAHLAKVIAIDFDKMKKDLEHQHGEFQAFAKEAYADIYR